MLFNLMKIPPHLRIFHAVPTYLTYYSKVEIVHFLGDANRLFKKHA